MTTSLRSLTGLLKRKNLGKVLALTLAPTMAACQSTPMKVVGDPQYGVRTSGFISTNVTPPVKKMVTPYGYGLLEQSLNNIHQEAAARLDSAKNLGTAVSLSQPVNILGPQGLLSLAQQEVRTPLDSVLTQMDSENLSVYNQQIATARSYTENDKSLTQAQLNQMIPYPQQNISMTNGVPNILSNMINIADTFGGSSASGAAIVGHVYSISAEYKKIADVRAKIVVDQDLLGYTNPVTNDVQQRSLSDQSGFSQGNSAVYGKRPFATAPENQNSIYLQTEPLYVQASLLRHAVILAQSIDKYPLQPISEQRLYSAADTLDSWDWNTVQMSPEELFSRMVVLGVVYQATPPDMRQGSLAGLELQRQMVIAKSMYTTITNQIATAQNGPMPGVPNQAQVNPLPLQVGQAHGGSFRQDIDRWYGPRRDRAPVQPDMGHP